MTAVMAAKNINILAAAGTWKTGLSKKKPITIKKINANAILMMLEKWCLLNTVSKNSWL